MVWFGKETAGCGTDGWMDGWMDVGRFGSDKISWAFDKNETDGEKGAGRFVPSLKGSEISCAFFI